MSDRVLSCDEKCLYTDEYLVTPISCCLGVHQAEAKPFGGNLLPENTFELPPNELANEKNGRKSSRIMDFLGLVRDFLLSHLRDIAEHPSYGIGESSGVLFISSGGSIQPILWNPESQNGKSSR